jgi:hypothetical protein
MAAGRMRGNRAFAAPVIVRPATHELPFFSTERQRTAGRKALLHPSGARCYPGTFMM